MTEATSEAALPLTGGCMCGAVRYSIAEQPLAMGLCHCDRCRPQSGSAFSTIIFVHRSAVTMTGEVAQFVTPDIMFIKAGGIDNNAWFHPAMELFVVRRRPWVSPVEGAAQFDGNPAL